jgi:hypothetical protein
LICAHINDTVSVAISWQVGYAYGHPYGDGRPGSERDEYSAYEGAFAYDHTLGKCVASSNAWAPNSAIAPGRGCIEYGGWYCAAFERNAVPWTPGLKSYDNKRGYWVNVWLKPFGYPSMKLSNQPGGGYGYPTH